jgi:hypothetical protein
VHAANAREVNQFLRELAGVEISLKDLPAPRGLAGCRFGARQCVEHRDRGEQSAKIQTRCSRNLPSVVGKTRFSARPALDDHQCCGALETLFQICRSSGLSLFRIFIPNSFRMALARSIDFIAGSRRYTAMSCDIAVIGSHFGKGQGLFSVYWTRSGEPGDKSGV